LGTIQDLMDDIKAVYPVQ